MFVYFYVMLFTHEKVSAVRGQQQVSQIEIFRDGYLLCKQKPV